VSRSVKIGDITQPVISQKKFAQDIRLREGEVNVIGGLLEDQDTKLNSGIPWLASLPVVGPLFGTNHAEINKNELLIVLVPHIVRAPDFTDANLRSVAAGSDQNVKLNYSPKPDPTPEQPLPTSSPAPATPGPAPTAPAPTAPADTPAPKPAAPTGPVRLFFNPPTVQTTLSGVVTVAIQIENANDLFSAPMKLKFDPKILRLTSIKQGNLLGGDGKKTNFSENTLNDSGDATITLSRTQGDSGITGSGALVTLTFQAVGRGGSVIAITEAGLANSAGEPIFAGSPLVNIAVQ
jgi:general secretion pathway protein D